ncbi:MAG: DUF4157 domain-containing protein [Kiloniellaceae bacterium]
MAALAPPQPKTGPGAARRTPVRAGPASNVAAPALQPKLEVGPARDRYEQEADRIADRVMRSPAPEAASVPPPTVSPLVVQRQAETDEQEEELQREADKPDTRVETFEVPEEEVERSQRDATSGGGGAASGVPAGVESSIASMRAGGGRPLHPAARSAIEPGLGHDLSGVRVHDGVAAANAAKAVKARAFTLGNDIFFGAGRYRPESTSGRRLIAHEAVHTLQQSGGSVRAQRLQRDGEGQVGDLEDDPGRTFQARPARVGQIELAETGSGGTLRIPKLKLPTIQGAKKGAQAHSYGPGMPGQGKAAIVPGTAFEFTGGSERGSTTARQRWLRDATTNVTPGLETAIPTKVQNWAGGFELLGPDNVRRRYVRLAGARASTSSLLIPGTPAELAQHEVFRLPTWDRRGGLAFYDVDHAQELQLGGLDGWDNFWLLDQSANRSSGSLIANEVRGKISGLLDAARDGNFWRGPNAGKAPATDSLRAGAPGWKVVFAGFDGLRISWSNRNAYWSRAEIIAGDHLTHLKAMNESELLSEGLVFRPGETPEFVSLFSSAAGGFRRRMRIEGENAVPVGRGMENFYTGFNLISATYHPPASADSTEELGRLEGRIFTNRIMQVQPITLNIMHAAPFGFGGHVNQEAMRAAIRGLSTQITGASPVSFTEAGIGPDGALFADGTISATKALFPGLEIPIRLRGNDIYIEFPIPTERLNFGPVHVTEAALQVGVGESGVFLDGSAAFEVDQVGSGMVSARVEEGNTILSGAFDVDLDFLETARAEATYDLGADTFTVSLTAGVGEGALPGVTGGEVTVTITRESVAVSGALQLAPPLEGAEITVAYTPEGGLTLAAENVPLPVDRLPGVSNATVSISATRNAETGAWAVSGAGGADLAVAGATGRLDIAVAGTAITISGRGEVERGPASGSIQVTVTNRPVDEDGNPVEGGEPAADFTAWGRGRVEITFGRVLQGSAEIELTPQGAIILTGTIGLPPNFEVFPRQSYERELLHIEPPEFPIWGVSVAGIGIGIFAFVDADVRFDAFIGPGELRETQVTATMNLDEPQNATIDGSARFFVPAGAGLTLDLGGGLRARLAVAYVQGRVGLDGRLGIEADASAGVQVHWSQNEGLSVEADVEATARPKFRIGANASVEAGVDVLVGSISHTWGPWRRTLGEFGPDMEFGITVPVRWSEREGFDFNIDDIEVRRPDIDAAQLMSSAFDELV